MESPVRRLIAFLKPVPWGLTVIFLWYMAILGPILMLLCLGSAFSVIKGAQVHGWPATSEFFIWTFAVLYAIAGAIGLSYVFYWSKRLDQKPGIKQSYAIIMLLFLLVITFTAAAWMNANYRSVILNLRVYEVTVNGFDAQTKEPLKSIAVQGPVMDSRDMTSFPRHFKTVAMGAGQVHLTWLDTEPYKVTFQAEGYLDQHVLVDSDTRQLNLYFEPLAGTSTEKSKSEQPKQEQ